MLDIKKVESNNRAVICGELSELDIATGVTTNENGEKREYVRGTATIKVETEIGGKLVENKIPINMFANKKTKAGGDSKVYASIMEMKESFVPMAAIDEDSTTKPTKVAVRGGKIDENTWFDTSTGKFRTSFRISSNFVNRANEEESNSPSATFELSGVVLGKTMEVDKNGEETGRLKVKLGVVGYNGKIDVIDLIAENINAVTHIQTNWEDGDTVSLAGIVNMTFKQTTYYEEQGFGEPIKRHKTESKKELLITGGSPSGLDEAFSYDADSVKVALAERKSRLAKIQEKAQRVKTPKATSNDYGF